MKFKTQKDVSNFLSQPASFSLRRNVWKQIPRSRRGRVFLRRLHQGSSDTVCQTVVGGAPCRLGPFEFVGRASPAREAQASEADRVLCAGLTVRAGSDVGFPPASRLCAFARPRGCMCGYRWRSPVGLRTRGHCCETSQVIWKWSRGVRSSVAERCEFAVAEGVCPDKLEGVGE